MNGTMKKVVILDKKQAGLVDMAIPKPKEDWVLVKMEAIPMCTEYKVWERGPQTPGSRINALGHEGAGVVVEVARPGPVKEGDRVVLMGAGPCGQCAYCQSGNFIHCLTQTDYLEFTGEAELSGAYAQYRLGADWLLPKIPDNVSMRDGSLAWCGLGPTFGAMQTIGLDLFDTVLITGAGPVGQGGIINAKVRGARVIVAELEPWRVERAKALGADVVVDPRDEEVVDQIKALTDGLGVTCAIECAGVVPAQRLCIDATRRKGHVVFVAESGDRLPITVSPDMIRKGLRLFGQWHYSLHDFDQIMHVVRQAGDRLDILNSHRFPMSQVQEALTVSASRQCGKIILDPWA